jgi:isochorismate synthase
MSEQLQALYHASLGTKSHLAFYRFPESNEIRGAISDSFTPLTNHSNGFAIGHFDPNRKAVVIPADVGFVLDGELTFHIGGDNAFAMAFMESYHSNTTGARIPHYRNAENHCAGAEEFKGMVSHAIGKIGSGVFRKAVLSRVKKVKYTKDADPLYIFLKLCSNYPNAFVSLVSSPDYGTWIGASPEVLMVQLDEDFRTVALAGTRKSGTETSFTGKEREEQQIIHDYIEDALTGLQIVAAPAVARDFDTGKLTHLKTELVFKTNISNRLEVLRALHPTPAVGGAPRGAALNFIVENEGYERGLYAGFIGPVSAREMHLFVNLRCMQWNPEYALVYAGAGITAGSDPEAEWEETESKMSVIGDLL